MGSFLLRPREFVSVFCFLSTHITSYNLRQDEVSVCCLMRVIPVAGASTIVLFSCEAANSIAYKLWKVRRQSRCEDDENIRHRLWPQDGILSLSNKREIKRWTSVHHKVGCAALERRQSKNQQNIQCCSAHSSVAGYLRRRWRAWWAINIGPHCLFCVRLFSLWPRKCPDCGNEQHIPSSFRLCIRRPLVLRCNEWYVVWIFCMSLYATQEADFTCFAFIFQVRRPICTTV